MTARLSLVLTGAALILTACPSKQDPGGGGPVVSNRCEADLAATGLFSEVGTGAKAKVISDASELIGGQSAEGQVGDYLLENDRIRVIISQPGRHFATVPYGSGSASIRALYCLYCFFCSSDPVRVSIQLAMTTSLLRRSSRSVHGGAVRCVL